MRASNQPMQGSDPTRVSQQSPTLAADTCDVAAPQHAHSVTGVQRIPSRFREMNAGGILQLQRTLGNQVVSQLLADSAPQQAAQPGAVIDRPLPTLAPPRIAERGPTIPNQPPVIARVIQPHGNRDTPTPGRVLQRDGDRTSSPFLPTYDEHELPGWKDETGIPEWAKEAYKQDAKRTVICSMTPDRKIGSVYFGEEGRIRTIHPAGPAHEMHAGSETMQFNIDQNGAWRAFLRAHTIPKGMPQDQLANYFVKWIGIALKDHTADTAPPWAALVASPDAAHALTSEPLPPDLKLYEIFKNINGRIESWHISRGVAAKFETDKQVISVLHAAIRHISAVTDPGERNRQFYAFVKSRLPKFVDYLRNPG